MMTRRMSKCNSWSNERSYQDSFFFSMHISTGDDDIA